MNVALVTLRFDAPGGVETTVRQLAQYLKSQGDQVTVYATDLFNEGRWERRTDFPDEVDGVPVRWFPVYKRLIPGLTLPLPVGMTEALRTTPHDLIHAHSHRYGHVLTSAAAAASSGGQSVISTHYHPASSWETPWRADLLRGQDFLFGASAYRIAARLIVETEFEAGQVREFAPAEKIRVVPPGIDLAQWKEAPPPTTATDPPLPERYLLFAGRIAPNKGLRTLIEALSRLTGSHRLPLVVMGRDWGEQASLEQLARARGVADRVIWLGHLKGAASYRRVVRRSTVFVLPSEYEAFGLVLLESMVAGSPIVATTVGGVPEVLAHGKAGRLVPYEDAAALAQAIEATLDDEATTRAMVQFSREYVEQFSLRRSMEMHREVYREVIEGGRSRRATSLAN